ncbi:MAG: hypothetical protein K2N25_02170 [Muribaculaceae bacterium]|nr:hypothetical protein [Muribaculaceae bacterium]
MKKFLLSLGAALVAISAMASSHAKIAPGLSSETDVITSVEGETVDVTMTSSGLTMSGYGLEEFNDRMLASHLVYGSDNEVYIYEIFPDLPTQSYVKGVRNGDKVVFELPQPIYYEFDPGLGFPEAYYLDILTMDEEEQWYVAEEKATLTFSVDAEGSMIADGLSRDVILGVADSDNGQWIGLGAWALTISSFNEEAVSVPEGLEIAEKYWTSVGNQYGWQVNFAKDGGDVYFQGLAERLPEAWVKGNVISDGGTTIVSIPQDQYVGDYSNYHIFTKCVRLEVDKDGYVFLEDFMPDDYEYQLVWDTEKETLTAKDDDVLLVFNVSKGDIRLLNDLTDMKLIRQLSFEGTPVNPCDLEFEDVMQDEEFSLFSFSLPAVSAEGEYLLLDDLSYIVYVDDEPWTFEAEDYDDMDESIEEIPWTYDKYWICKDYESPVHHVAFFVEGITTIGVQSVYRHNGKETRSEIVTINVDEIEAVDGLAVDSKAEKVTYYDVSGREVSNPAKGIFLKVSKMSDGTIRTEKLLR